MTSRIRKIRSKGFLVEMVDMLVEIGYIEHAKKWVENRFSVTMTIEKH